MPRAKPGHHRCPRHGIEYKALEQCPKCHPADGSKADPGPAPAEKKLKLPKPPKGCVTAAQREAWFVKLADETLKDVARLAKELARGGGGGSGDEDDGTWHTENAIKAHRDTAIKAMRAAHELGSAREEAELVEERRRANAAEAR